MKIVTRAEWGFNGWLNGNTPYAVDEKAKRTEWFVHYEGGNPVLAQTGVRVPRDIHAFHKGQGWKGIGYGHVVDANGTIFEGRGFNMVGSHCPDHNTSGYSVQFHLGGNEKPTQAQIDAGRWLYAEACRRSSRRLAIKGHRDGFATSCPGPNLYALVKNGTFATAPSPAVPEEDDMPSAAEVADEILKRPVNDYYGGRTTVGEAIGITLRNSTRAAIDATAARAVAEASAKASAPLSEEDVQRIAEAAAREVGEGFTVEGAIVPKDGPQ